MTALPVSRHAATLRKPPRWDQIISERRELIVVACGIRATPWTISSFRDCKFLPFREALATRLWRKVDGRRHTDLRKRFRRQRAPISRTTWLFIRRLRYV
jgi:hypothetical protein